MATSPLYLTDDEQSLLMEALMELENDLVKTSEEMEARRAAGGDGRAG